MPTYKDVDAILGRLPDDLPYKASVKRVLIQAPEADVVKVVRCKDCAHYVEMHGYEYANRKARVCVWHSALRGENAFCSDGMRKGGK